MKRIIQFFILIVILLALVPCISEAKIIAVSHGAQMVMALNDQGDVWMWGNGIPPDSAQKVSIDNVTAISAGGSNYALKSDGTVWAWGYGGQGRLGNGGTDSHDTPVQVSGLTNVIAISAGDQNGYALKADGTVWAWGINSEGQLGQGTYGAPAYSTTPVQILGLTNIVALGVNGGYAVKKDGTVYTWLNLTLPYPDGQPGTFQVPDVGNVKQIVHSRAWPHTIFLKNDGTVWGWGDNQNGEMGNGTYIPMIKVNNTYEYVFVWPPVQASIGDVKQISGGILGCIDALKNDGTVWEWGVSQLNIPRTGTFGLVSPVQVSGLDHIIQISPEMALKDDGTVWGWGENFGKWLKDAGNDTIIRSPVIIFEEPEQPATPTPSPSPTVSPGPAISETPTPTIGPTGTVVVSPGPSGTAQPTGTNTPSSGDDGLIFKIAGAAALVLVAGALIYLWVTKRL